MLLVSEPTLKFLDESITCPFSGNTFWTSSNSLGQNKIFLLLWEEGYLSPEGVNKMGERRGQVFSSELC